MATFAGTTQKCKACEKTVYLVDQLKADSKVYHKACFRCHHCKGTLKHEWQSMRRDTTFPWQFSTPKVVTHEKRHNFWFKLLSNYNSYEGVLYCRPHFDQLFKMTGSLNKSFEGGPRTVKERSVDKAQSNNKVSALFGGTQDKCVACKKTVYPLEKVAVDGTSYHRPCFKCSHGGCVISPSNYVAHDHKLYCRHHHTQLFKQRGNFSHMEDHEKIKEVTENGKA